MAEDLEDFEEGEGSESAAGKSGGGKLKKVLLFIVLPVLVLIGAGAGAYFSGAADALMAKLGFGQEPEPVAVEAPKTGLYYDLPDMLVNLNTSGRKQSFLKIRVSLELPDAAAVQQVEAAMPRVIDQFQVYLRELRVEDLQGSAGMYRLREELLIRVSAAVKPAKVSDILFKEMLVQ